MRPTILLLIGILLIIVQNPVYCDNSMDFIDQTRLNTNIETIQEIKTVYNHSILEEMRTKAYNLTKCPEIEDYYHDENCSMDADEKQQSYCNEPKDGWIVYPCDPTVILQAFPHLQVQENKKIAGYYFREFLGGNAQLSVVDKDTILSIPDNISELSITDNLPGGDPDFMSYITGDGSPDAYLEASLLSRELPDIEAFWHGINWGTHSILDDELLRVKNEETEGFISKIPNQEDLDGPDWNWTAQKPERYDPVVLVRNDSAIVQFYTFSGLHSEKIVRHTDRYSNNSYKPDSEEETLATGKFGFYF